MTSRETLCKDKRVKNFINLVTTSDLIQTKLTFLEDTTYTSKRLRLLARLRHCLNLRSAVATYQSMILPIFMYSGILMLKLSHTQLLRLELFHCRSVKILSREDGIKIPLVSDVMKKRACTLVHECLDGNVCSPCKSILPL